MCERVQYIPLPFAQRAQLVATGIMTKALYGCAATPPSKATQQKLRSAAGKAVWGQGNRWRCNEILFTSLCQGHRIDAIQATAYATFMVARRVLGKQQELWPMYCDVFELRMQEMRRSSRVSTIGGPVLALLQAASAAGGMFENPGLVSYRAPNNTQQRFLLLEGETKKMAHEVREGLRAEQYVLLEDRRPSFEGIAYNGLDRKSTEVILSDKITGFQKYMLRCIMAGAMASCSRLHKAKILDSPRCCCCGAQMETFMHIVDDCPALAHTRFREFSPSEWAQLPSCTRSHGLVPICLDPASIPPRYQGEPKALAADVQYTLIDMFLHRASLMGRPAPQPRW